MEELMMSVNSPTNSSEFLRTLIRTCSRGVELLVKDLNKDLF